MIYNCITNVYASIGMLVILVFNMSKFIANVFVRYDKLVILVKNLFKSKNYFYLVQTTKKCSYISQISAYKTRNRRVCSLSVGTDDSHPQVMGNIELDTHADTIVAGANCCVLNYTVRICDVSPYSEEYKPVSGVPIVRAATVWQSQYTGQEYLLIFNEALWMPSLPNTLVNPNQLRAFGTVVQDNPYSNEPLFIESSDSKFNMELHLTGTVILQVPELQQMRICTQGTFQ